jgi:pimeloyl-ACP methyl ester carboxylesterase
MSTRPPLHFSHANSFPAGSYRKFLAPLSERYAVGYIDVLGHDPRYPVTDCWPHLVQETLDFIANRYTEPVIAVGHSLGGFLSFMAALRRPELFRAIVLLDSPVFARPISTALWLGKRLGFIDRITPGRGTRTRRRHWPSVDAAIEHFRGKGLFAGFDPDCLRDYCEAGTVPVADGVRLRFDPEIEYQIYCGLPHVFPRYRGQLRVPAGFIGGQASTYVRRSDVAQMRRHFGMQVMTVPGGHLFPFEHPHDAAAAVQTMLTRLGVA